MRIFQSRARFLISTMAKVIENVATAFPCPYEHIHTWNIFKEAIKDLAIITTQKMACNNIILWAFHHRFTHDWLQCRGDNAMRRDNTCRKLHDMLLCSIKRTRGFPWGINRAVGKRKMLVIQIFRREQCRILANTQRIVNESRHQSS
jgi:predicted RNA-binding Zn-ribbon protein involved in translation (DUF1610 family)